MNNLDLPPFPVLGSSGPQVCEAVRFYLALVDELPFEQVRILSEHVKGCAECAAEFHLLQQTTRMLASLPASTPSARVDNAIQAFLYSQQQAKSTPVPLSPAKSAPIRLQPTKQTSPLRQTLPARRHSRRRVGTLALVAALLLALALGGVFLRGLIWPATSNPTAFALPANLSWGEYVLHYVQTKIDAQGRSYQVEIYQDLGTNQMHIESKMQGEFDVVVVIDQQTMLGKDMMHHVAQEGNAVANWAVDGSTFDLGQLRQDLTTQHAVYLGQSTFANQPVYQIRTSNGQVLLLNMQYFPVNVLSTSSSSGTPMYATFALVPNAQVSDAMWDMQVPSNFHMGELPTKS
jgi:hypothetical protein